MASSTLEYASTDAPRPSGARRRPAPVAAPVAQRLSLVAFGIIAAVALAAAAAPVIMPYDPDAPDAEHALEAPSRRHWLGTDLYGRDQLSRIIYAGRVDLLVALGGDGHRAVTWRRCSAPCRGIAGDGSTSSSCAVIDTIHGLPVVHPRHGHHRRARQ